jgi:acyl carrier protein
MSTESSLSCQTLRSREEVLKQVTQIVSAFSDVSPEEIRENHLLLRDLGMDSLDLVECTMEAEEEFDISIPDQLVEQVKTVGDVVDGVMELLARAHSKGATQP